VRLPDSISRLNFNVFLCGLPFGLPLAPGLNLVASPAPEGPRKPVFDIVIILKSCFDFFVPRGRDTMDLTAGTGEMTQIIKCALAVLGARSHFTAGR
jgi:hypothetical protein